MVIDGQVTPERLRQPFATGDISGTLKSEVKTKALGFYPEAFDGLVQIGGSGTDLVTLAFDAIFTGSLVAASTLLLLSYLGFVRMNKDVRRARLFLMADRVRRFLGAFTVGFLLIAAAAALTLTGLPSAGSVFVVVIILFLAAIVYGSLELFLIVRPRRSSPVPRLPAKRAKGGSPPKAQRTDPAGGDGPAPR